MLESYKKILKKKGLIHLKTDSEFLHGFTLGILDSMNVEIVKSTHDLYKSKIDNSVLKIKTFYETMFLKKETNNVYLF